MGALDWTNFTTNLLTFSMQQSYKKLVIIDKSCHAIKAMSSYSMKYLSIQFWLGV